MRSLLLTLGFLLAFHPRAGGAPPARALPATDQAYLEALMHDFLFDPAGAQRIALVVRDEEGHVVESDDWSNQAWLVPGAKGQPVRAFSTDGQPVPIEPGSYRPIDFKAACRARYDHAPRLVHGYPPHYDEEDIAVAAWLHRLHEPALAAKALAAARRQEGDPAADLRRRLARAAYMDCIGSFENRADEAALATGRHLRRVYPEEAKEDDFDQVEPIFKDLERRRQNGTFGKEPDKQWPAGFEQWDAARKTAYVIDSLEDIHRRQSGFPGGVDFAADRRVKELIRLGDAAVPPLIDALEKDDRLTRSTQSWRMGMGTTVLNVREPILTALMSILQVQVFEFGATGDNFTARGKETAAATAQRLREYWKEYGGVPSDERLMKVLTNPKASFEAKREAAANLGALGRRPRAAPCSAWARASSSRPRSRSPRSPSSAIRPLRR